MKKYYTVLFVFVIAASCMGCGFLYEREYFVGSDIVFGTDLTIDVWLLGKNSPQAFAAMTDELKVMDAEISLTRTSSSLSRLNSSAVDEVVEVGKHTYAMWELACRYHENTSGAFNPSVVDLSELWGVGAGASAGFGQESQDPLPDYQAVTDAAGAIGQLASKTGVLFGVAGYVNDGKYYLKKLDAAAKLDFGAIAKGYAADRCIEIAKEYGITSAIVDLAGNIKTLGQFQDDSGALLPFTVSVTDPRSYGIRGAAMRERLFVLSVSQTEYSVVVSGDYERYYEYVYAENDRVPICHILNPFTGMPLGVSFSENRYHYDSDNAVISAMIANESSALADAYTTAVCVMGFENGVRFLQQQQICGVMMTENRLTFVGIGKDDLYQPNAYGTYARYGTQIEYAEFFV